MCYIWLFWLCPAVVWPRAGAGNEGGAPALAAVCPVPRVQVGSGGWLHTGTCRDKTGAAIRSTDGDEECCSGYPHQEAIKPLTRRQNKTITSSSNHKSQAGCLLVVRWPVGRGHVISSPHSIEELSRIHWINEINFMAKNEMVVNVAHGSFRNI